MAVLIKSGIIGLPRTVKPKNGEKFTLEELQELVGGYIQLAPHMDNEHPMFKNKIIVVDEEGVIKNKPVNNMASALSKQRLVGDVLLCDQSEME